MMATTYEVGQRVEVERLAAGMYYTGTIVGPTWTGATVVSFDPRRGVAGTFMLDVDGYPPGGVAWPEVMRPIAADGRTEAGKALEALHEVVGWTPLLRLVADEDTSRVGEAWRKADAARGSMSAEALVEFFDTFINAAPADVSGWPGAVLTAAAAAERALNPLVTLTPWPVGARVEVKGFGPGWGAQAAVEHDGGTHVSVRFNSTKTAHVERDRVRAATSEPVEEVDRVIAELLAKDAACRQVVAVLSAPAPEHNARCTCGAPALALLTSLTCSRGAECTIVAGEPEPDDVRLVWAVANAQGRYQPSDERVYEASGNGHEHQHPTREGAVSLWHRGEAAGRRWDSIEPLPPKPKEATGVDLVTIREGEAVFAIKAGDLVVRDADGSLRAVVRS